MIGDPGDDRWIHRRRQSDRAAILAAVAMLLGTISLAFTLSDEWPRDANRSALALWFLVLPVTLWIGGWTGFIAREARSRTVFLVLACAAAGAGLFLRPGELFLLSLGEFGMIVLVAGTSLVLRRNGLDEVAERSGEDGLGQNLAEELRWWRRFRRARRSPLSWRAPGVEENREILTHPTMKRFADAAVALAEWEGRRWIVLERDWHGWPDPERYVLFVLENEEVWLAWDFAQWPDAWGEPPA